MQGKLYEQQGEFQKALQAYLESESIYNTTLKERAIDDVSHLCAMAILGFKRKDEYMARYYFNLHIKLFGLNHPRTFEVIDYAQQHNLPIPYGVLKTLPKEVLNSKRAS